MASTKKTVRATRAFHDIKENADRKEGEVFECTATRMKELVEAYPDRPLVVEVDGSEPEQQPKQETTEAA